MNPFEYYLVGAVVLLISKIVWDWLKGRGEETKQIVAVLLAEISKKIDSTNDTIDKFEKKFDKFEDEVFERLRKAESEIEVLKSKVVV